MVERDQSNLPKISIQNVLPFKINIYETQAEKTIMSLDIVRMAIIIALFSSIPIRIVVYFNCSTRDMLVYLAKKEHQLS